MSHSVFVHYIFNILLLLLLLIGFLYPMPFIYKDTKKNHVCNFNNISPSFNIQSYFINSLNQKYFLNISFLPQFLQGKITQHSLGSQEESATQFSASVLKSKMDTRCCLEHHKKQTKQSQEEWKSKFKTTFTSEFSELFCEIMQKTQEICLFTKIKLECLTLPCRG